MPDSNPHEHEQIAGVGRSDIIPGKVLMPLRIPGYAELQRQFEANYLRTAIRATEGLPDHQASRGLDHAEKVISSGKFRYGMEAFDKEINSFENLPFLLYLLIRESDPKITPAGAALLITDENRGKVYAAALNLAGYAPPQKKSE